MFRGIDVNFTSKYIIREQGQGSNSSTQTGTYQKVNKYIYKLVFQLSKTCF